MAVRKYSPVFSPAYRIRAVHVVLLHPLTVLVGQVSVVYSNISGSDPLFTYCGKATVALPDGSIAQAGPRDTTLVELDYVPEKFDFCRQRNPYLSAVRATITFTPPHT